MYEYQAEKLFIKKSDIESALGISLDDIPTKKFSFLDENCNQTATLEDYLKPYALMDRFTLDESIALLLGENPDDPFQPLSEHRLYDGTNKLLERELERGELNNIGGMTRENKKISHSELEQWAKRYGYNWKLPPYSSSDTNQNLKKPEPQDQTELNLINIELEQAKATIQAKDEQIAELEKQLEQAKGAESAVDYQNYSIHGHTSDNFCVLFKISKLITEKCDPDNPHSYPNKEQFREYVKKYHSDSKELADAFYKIIIPEKVKNRGRTPQGVETFTGF